MQTIKFKHTKAMILVIRLARVKPEDLNGKHAICNILHAENKTSTTSDPAYGVVTISRICR